MLADPHLTMAVVDARRQDLAREAAAWRLARAARPPRWARRPGRVRRTWDRYFCRLVREDVLS
jgi:hypothetical protein